MQVAATQAPVAGETPQAAEKETVPDCSAGTLALGPLVVRRLAANNCSAADDTPEY